MKAHIDHLNEVLEDVDAMRRLRETNFSYIRDVVATNVRRKFNLLIEDFARQTNSDIFLRIDTKRKELVFSFSSASSATNGGGGSKSGIPQQLASVDVTTLSGGEKSFTQMCLICSLWEVMQPPFRYRDTGGPDPDPHGYLQLN